MILYGGIVKRKWAVNSAFMCFYAYAATLIVWVVFAYKLGFGKPWGAAPFVGEPGPIIGMDWELRQALLPTSNVAPNFPQSTLVYFQFVFAATTIIIACGAFLARM